MKRRIMISESDYRAITQWDDDGGRPVEIDYEVVPDRKARATGASPAGGYPNNEPGTVSRIQITE